GSGGQGIVLAGLIFAEAVGVHDRREVAMVQSYGPEARGGASKVEIIVSDDPIDYPLCANVDLLLALTQEAADTYSLDLKPNAWVLVDSELVTHPPTRDAIVLPFSKIARDTLEKVMAANIVALGAVSHLTGLVTHRALEKALLARVPGETSQLNRRALNLGVKAARDYLRKKQSKAVKEIQVEDM
ncbi:MAG: 2-oxoacid:acceptor oxidoreductase family protein, partial [Desulfomonile sp.]|nr:2-oxoacid:acceptor oxidoreductase family protein [Desulfomonile sp.]